MIKSNFDKINFLRSWRLSSFF